MKKNIHSISLLLLAISVFTSCSDDDSSTLQSSEEMSQTIEQYVNNTVVVTYKLLADNALDLQTACEALQNNPTQVNVDAACDKWIVARKYWEESEAFLYGAASDYNIDPHIDSWPLDKTQLDNLLSNSTVMANFDADYAGTYLGYGLLGFHAVEYVLFRDGEPRDINDISTTELKYMVGVAEDLARQTIRLEASWAGIDNVTTAKQTILSESELEPSMNYGEALIAAGETGNTLYKSQIAAYVQILTGCMDIADEVGNTKITDPVNSENVLDVESWYSWNSISDFSDNIRSVQNAYLGGREGSRSSSLSVSHYIAEVDSELDANIKAAIVTAINAIEAMPAPFRNNLTWSTNNLAALNACNNLMDLLNDAIETIQK